MMYLQQEKDRLDRQVTGLLEEKARWLIAQQDLVRTVSIKVSTFHRLSWNTWMSDLGPKWVRLAPNEINLGLFQIRFHFTKMC